MEFQTKKILITVKTYPNPSRTYNETVCVAGILLDDPPSWIRLYPIPFRNLNEDQRFKKFDVIEAKVKKNTQDSRPESHKVIAESINITRSIGTENNWQERKDMILPLRDESMCCIQSQRDENRKSLGLFKPREITDFLIEELENRDWTEAERNCLSQLDFFSAEQTRLEKIPYKFKIQYYCTNPKCNGHNQGLIDWETAQLFRKLKNKYKNEAEVKDKLKDKYLNEVFSQDKDFYLIVGNQFDSPKSFLILSVFWPRIEKQIPLFDYVL